ncbi:MAG TPA: DUF4367 domain-containing protein [Candidatus Baltobacteraceae bacterium]|nr:DUF4367 domain-containing protein [Candidatus Baltobacteraceae bacterium]
MSHLDDAVLRRYVDEPGVLLSYEKEHLMRCTRCRSRLDALRGNATDIARVLGGNDEEVDMRTARESILARAANATVDAGADAAYSVPATTFRWQWSSAFAAALLVVMMFSYAPFRAYAQNFLTIFEPRQFAPVSMTQADLTQLRAAPGLADFGTVKESGTHKMTAFTSLHSAERFARQTILSPAYLPPKAPRTATYHVSAANAISFTFDQRKALASAARKHVSLPPLPANLNGSTLTTVIGPLVVQSYGEMPQHGHRIKHARSELRFPRDTVVIAQGPVPSVHSTAARPQEVESYLLSLPNVPEDVKAQIRAIGDPASTLPVPIPVDKQTARKVNIGGAQGLLVGDNTGLGSIVVWQSKNMMYSVAGGYTADEILKVANSMKP